MLVDSVHREHIGAIGTARRIVPVHLRNKFGRNRIDIFGDGLPGAVACDDQPGEILVEQIADHLDQHVGLFVESHRRTGGLGLDHLGLLGDRDPSLLQSGDIAADVFLLDAFGRRADDHAGVGGHHFAQDLLEPLTFGVRKLAADAGGRRARHIDEVPAGQRQLRGEPGALVSDRVLADLDDDIIAGFEGLLDLATCPAESGRLPVDLTGIEHAVATATDVDERGFHRRQHVLHDAEVDIADQRCRRGRGDEVFDDDAVLENRDLGVARTFVRRLGSDFLPNHHDPVDRLPAGQELGLGKDRRAPATGVAAVAATLPLRLQAGGTADALDLAGLTIGLLSRCALMHHGVGRVVRT